MPDICMCFNPVKLKIDKDGMSARYCPKKDKCYRYKAVPDEVQSYSKFYKVGEKCKYFMEIPD